MSEVMKLPTISVDVAAETLNLPRAELSFYSWPETFGDTSGPFSRPGTVSGQAFTTFQMEAWSDGMRAFIFANGKPAKLVSNWVPMTMGSRR